MALFPQQDDQQHEHRDYENERDERIPVHRLQPRALIDAATMTTIEVEDGDKAARAVLRGTDSG